MKLAEIIAVLHEIAPLPLAESWDNVGLLVGDESANINRCLLTIDYTPEVAAEARNLNCEFVVSYHPPIFDGLKRLNAGTLIFDAIRQGVAIYSPHTALDVAPGGTNDMLAEILGLQNIRPLRRSEPAARECKLVTFVPDEHVPAVAEAMFNAGAGHIGHYSSCSFRSPGEGTFLGDDSTHPAVGQKNIFQKVAEVRLETVVPLSQLSDVLASLHRSHPYETPAIDLIQLHSPPNSLGQGRIGELPNIDRARLFEQIKNGLSQSHLLVAGPTEGSVRTAACLAGAGRQHVPDAQAQCAELYLTGEIPHHDALKAARAGMTVVAVLHSNSERAILPRLANRLTKKIPALDVRVSSADRDPFSYA